MDEKRKRIALLDKANSFWKTEILKGDDSEIDVNYSKEQKRNNDAEIKEIIGTLPDKDKKKYISEYWYLFVILGIVILIVCLV